MKMFRVLSFAFAAAAVVAAAFSPVVDVFKAGYAACSKMVAHAFALASPEAEAQRKPQVYFVQARAFVARLVKRERPVLTNSWRMCPSV